LFAGSLGPLSHIHCRRDEASYILEGEPTVRIGAWSVAAQAGSFVLVPRGVAHRPANPGPQPARFLRIFSPGGMDRFFCRRRRARADPGARERPSRPRILADFSARYAFELADLPAALPARG
jgi:uncharacterized cupin superfamily protein